MKQEISTREEKRVLLQYWFELSAFAYRNYLRKGRGAIVIRRKDLVAATKFSTEWNYLPLQKAQQLIASETSPEIRKLIGNYFPDKSVVVLVVEERGTGQPYLLSSLPTPLQTYHAARAYPERRPNE